MTGRVIRRPVGGWGARTWRRDVWAWLALAVLCVGASGASAMIYKTIDFVSAETR
jgi:hypothetical protein